MLLLLLLFCSLGTGWRECNGAYDKKSKPLLSSVILNTIVISDEGQIFTEGEFYLNPNHTS